MADVTSVESVLIETMIHVLDNLTFFFLQTISIFILELSND